MAEITCTSLYGFTSFQAWKQSGRTWLPSNHHCSHMVSYRMRKLKHLTAQFDDESVEYTIKGMSIQYELLECAIKGKSMLYELKT